MVLTKSLVSKLVQVAQNKLGRESLGYKIGTKTYLLICHLLRTLNVPARYFEDDLVLIKKIIHQSLEFKPNAEGKHIVFLSTRGWPVHLSFEALLAARLRMDGHRVTFLSCFDSIPLCMYGSSNHLPELQRNCEVCMANKVALWEGVFEVEYFPCAKAIKDSIEVQVEQLDLSGCQAFEFDRAPYGDLVYRGIVWFLRRSRLSDADVHAYRMALIGAHTVRRGLEDFLSRNKVNTVVMINGDFLSEKVASWVLQQNGIRFITHDYTFLERLAVAVSKSVWDDLSFMGKQQSPQINIHNAERRKAENLLRSWRRHGGYQGHLFWSKNNLKVNENLHNMFDLDSRPIAVAYTNMTFESSVICKGRVFHDQFQWLEKLFVFFGLHQEFQLIIRIHPAEVRQSHWRPNESLYHFSNNNLRTIPGNVHIVEPDNKISSYAIGEVADAVLVYSSTLGMEMADRNKCVITAAHVHYANRGFTIDPNSESDFFASILDVMQGRYHLSKMHRQCLVDYIAWLFFHRLTPFEAISGIREGWPQVNVSDISDLLSARYPGIQRIAKLVSDGIKWW
ncbi:MAG: hypothetical protein JW925_11295 [Syntrophaceae bacterium]|nr:hypothetical protein [Syntrophaceae bacterium]